MLFSQIPGLEDIKASLISAVKNHHIAHGQLFFGNPGCANLAMAMAFATYINCEEKKEEDACGVCPSCIKYNKLIHPDLHFVFPVCTNKQVTKDPLSSLFMKDWRQFVAENPYAGINEWGSKIGAENKQLNINVDEARNVIKTLSLKAYEAEYKVMILWLPENMNLSAANGLLKILEEPPQKTLFFLVTNNLEKIITTILSRTQKVKIPSFKEEEISKSLIAKEVNPKKATQLAYLADGNMNEAYRLMEEVEEDNHELFQEWMRLCYKRNTVIELIDKSEDFQKLGREGQKNLLHYGLNIMRETLIFKLAGREMLRLQEEELAFVEKFSKSLTESKIEGVINLFNEAYYHIERNANPKITFVDMSLHISGLFKSA